MPTQQATSSCTATRTCRWEEIRGARVKGGVISTKIWICEYPYRTMRRNGPSDDCTDCPVYHEVQQQKERERQEHLNIHPPV